MKKQHDLPVKSHLEKDETKACGSCGTRFSPDEVVIEREFVGKKWRFCSPECLAEFTEQLHFTDEEKDAYDTDVKVHGDD